MLVLKSAVICMFMSYTGSTEEQAVHGRMEKWRVAQPGAANPMEQDTEYNSTNTVCT